MSDALTKPTLPTFSWIGHLKPDDRDLLSSYGEFFPGHPGNIIIQEAEQQTEVFVVISGQLEVRAKQEDGTETLLARVGPGETLGEISLFTPGPATATVIAVEFSQLWRIADEDLIQFMQDNPGAGNVLLRTLATILAQRLRRVDPKAFGLSAYAVVASPELTEESAPSRPPVVSEPVADVMKEEPVVVESKPAADLPPPAAPAVKGKKSLTKTQALPNPDELEPL